MSTWIKSLLALNLLSAVAGAQTVEQEIRRREDAREAVYKAEAQVVLGQRKLRVMDCIAKKTGQDRLVVTIDETGALRPDSDDYGTFSQKVSFMTTTGLACQGYIYAETAPPHNSGYRKSSIACYDVNANGTYCSE